MKLALALALSLFSVSAFAYKDGTYTCKNGQGLPANVYVVKTIEVGGVQLPYLELTRHFHKQLDPSQPVQTVHTKGLAMLSSVDGKDVLLIGALRYEFEGDRLVNCK